jgi:hypothetical protein
MAFPKSVVVLAIDRLGAAWLGPYGNTWLDTPNFNQLAVRSTLFETAITAAPDLSQAYRTLWTGRHVWDSKLAAEPTLPAAATANGSAILLTDDESVAKHELATHFSEIHFERPGKIEKNALSVEQTDLFGFFEAACELVGNPNRPNLIWLHSRGMSGPWDAPLEFRQRFADDDDPEPLAFVSPPEKQLNEQYDPDEVLGYVQAYAGQIALTDLCLGMLLETLDSHPLAAETLFAILSPRGYPLGEHRRVGQCDNALYGELVHVPLVVRFPQDRHRLGRNRQIAQLHQVLRSLVTDNSDIVQRNIGPRPEPRAAFAIGVDQRAIRTPAWFLRESTNEGKPNHELFAKPDDRFEVNEISSRCGDVVELLAAELDRFAAAAASGELPESPQLAEVLYDTWR